MHDPTSRRHPLNIARAQTALIAQRVRVIDRARENICDGFDAPVRMPRKAFFELAWMLAAKIIKQQKWIKGARVMEPKGTVQMDASAFHGRLR
jgi:hypothetical protein